MGIDQDNQHFQDKVAAVEGNLSYLKRQVPGIDNCVGRLSVSSTDQATYIILPTLLLFLLSHI